MKKNEIKINTTKPSSAKAMAGKKEKMTLEKLALMMARGFERVQQTMATKDEVEKLRQEFRQGQTKLEQGQTEIKQEVAEIKQEVAEIKHEVEGIKEEVSSLKEEQKETNRQLTSTQRKQAGTLLSLDETVHRSEFNKLAQRVKLLES